MLKYLIEQQQPQIQEETLCAIKRHFIKKKQYRPFHLDCQFTRKKLCYCARHPIATMSPQSRVQLWQSYEHAHHFYKKSDSETAAKAKKLFTNAATKIQSLSRQELAVFVRNFRSEKNLHIGQNGQYENV